MLAKHYFDNLATATAEHSKWHAGLMVTNSILEKAVALSQVAYAANTIHPELERQTALASMLRGSVTEHIASEHLRLLKYAEAGNAADHLPVWARS